ncbi:MAG: DoxX family protein [Alphaproteobacteria bacterium]
MMNALFDPIKGYANWALRISFAATFLFHGWDKVASWSAGPGASFPSMMSGFGEPTLMGYALAGLVTFAELAAGLGILAGIFLGSTITRLSGLAVIPVMLGAIFMVHLPSGFNNVNMGPDGFGMPGWEFNLALLAMGVFFLIAGNNDSEA